MSGISKLARDLIQWYDDHQRDLPWNKTHDPYRIWVSEIILQQTQVQQGLPYYHNFVIKFPNVSALAEADLNDVLKAWEGLGYYSRARNLHKGAKFVIQNFDGKLPENRKDLLTIPGIGPYTSAAIAAFAFGQKEAAIDGNLMRVLTRLHTFPGDIHKASTRKDLENMALNDMGHADPAAYNRAMMDLGSSICTATNPDCNNCPVRAHCRAFATGQVSEFPFSTKKVVKKKRYLHYLLCLTPDAQGIRYHQRDDSGIWKGLYELPLIETEKQKKLKTWSLDGENREIENIDKRKHLLTHRTLYITFYRPLEEKIPKEIVSAALAKTAFPVPIRTFLNGQIKGQTG